MEIRRDTKGGRTLRIMNDVPAYLDGPIGNFCIEEKKTYGDSELWVKVGDYHHDRKTALAEYEKILESFV